MHNGSGSNSAMQTVPYFASRSGSIARLEASHCLLRLTTARALELE